MQLSQCTYYAVLIRRRCCSRSPPLFPGRCSKVFCADSGAGSGGERVLTLSALSLGFPALSVPILAATHASPRHQWPMWARLVVITWGKHAIRTCHPGLSFLQSLFDCNCSTAEATLHWLWHCSKRLRNGMKIFGTAWKLPKSHIKQNAVMHRIL